MALFNFVIASLTALLSSFLSLSPTTFEGLGPWFDTLGAGPLNPSPVAFPKAFPTPAVWEAIPTFNLTWDDDTPPMPTPTPTPSFVLNEEDDGETYTEPSPEQATAGERLRELRRLLKLALLQATLRINRFVLEHPYLGCSKAKARLRRLRWPTRQSRQLARSRSVDRLVSRSPVRWKSAAARGRASSCTPALPSAPPPVPGPSTPLPSSPPVPADLPSFTDWPSSPPYPLGPFITRIKEQQMEIKYLNAQIEELRRRESIAAAAATAVAPATGGPPLSRPVFITGNALRGPSAAGPPLSRPVFITGNSLREPSATGPPLPQPVFSTGKALRGPASAPRVPIVAGSPSSQPVVGTGKARREPSAPGVPIEGDGRESEFSFRFAAPAPPPSPPSLLSFWADAPRGDRPFFSF